MGKRVALGKGAATVALCLGLMTQAALAACDEGKLRLRGDFGEAAFRVRVADDPDERALGLMLVPEMPRFEGMLFAYDAPRDSIAFWMRNTLIPLDLLFIDSAGVVTRVHADAVPMDETPIPGGPGVQYVLEINGGLAATLGITAGAEAQHPLFGESAAWRCE